MEKTFKKAAYQGLTEEQVEQKILTEGFNESQAFCDCT